jgi:hypothetical protein
MCEQELKAWDWYKKINERLTFLILKVQDHKDIAESDYDLLRVLYPIWRNQEYPLYVSKMEGESQNVTQASLFMPISSVTGMEFFNGTLLEDLEEEPNLNEK